MKCVLSLCKSGLLFYCGQCKLKTEDFTMLLILIKGYMMLCAESIMIYGTK